MNKFCISVVLIIVSALTFIGIACGNISNEPKYQNSDFLRIHIRANSNLDADQIVKYKVKNEIVNVMNSFLIESKTKSQAMKVVEQNLSLLTQTANSVLLKEGFTYKATAKLTQENFPTRCYDEVVLNAGNYDALVINLGSGSGDNWWCVVYPPLCFVGGEDNNQNNIVYRSKLLEIIKSFFA